MKAPGFLSRGFGYLRGLVRNVYFWGAAAVLLLCAFGLYLLVDGVVMPIYTRQDAALTVPQVVNLPYEQAARELQARDLEVEQVVQNFNPNLPQDVVVDQNPPPDARVKPGRTVFLTVNTGRRTMVTIPSVEGLSLREARNRLQAVGLRLEEALPDSIPHPHQNTITRQEPAPGDSLAEGSGVRLWYSTGLGEQFATVPDVTGMTVAEADSLLLQNRLRSVVIGGVSEEEDEENAEENPSAQVVQRQGREPGTRVPEGFEIRLYLEQDAPAPPEGGLDF